MNIEYYSFTIITTKWEPEINKQKHPFLAAVVTTTKHNYLLIYITSAEIRGTNDSTWYFIPKM